MAWKRWGVIAEDVPELRLADNSEGLTTRRG